MSDFRYRWGGQGSSKNPCTETYGGTGAFSEPETAAIQKFITGKQFCNFHSRYMYVKKRGGNKKNNRLPLRVNYLLSY